jgi:hypothetical protein
MCLHVDMHMRVQVPGWTEVSEPLELELQKVLSLLMWVLRTEREIYGRATSASRLSHPSTPPPRVCVLNIYIVLFYVGVFCMHAYVLCAYSNYRAQKSVP